MRIAASPVAAGQGAPRLTQATRTAISASLSLYFFGIFTASWYRTATMSGLWSGVAGDDGGLCGVAALEHGLARDQAKAAPAFALGVARVAVLDQQRPNLCLEEIEVGGGKLHGGRAGGKDRKNAEGDGPEKVASCVIASILERSSSGGRMVSRRSEGNTTRLVPRPD